MTSRRRSANIYDYPEHLNPFHEDDNHSKLRFWTVTKKKTRSNSFSMQSIKDFKGTLFSRSRDRSGTANSLSELSCYRTNPKTPTTNTDNSRKSFIYPTLRKLGRTFSIRSKNKRSSNSLDRSSDSIEKEVVESRYYSSNRQTLPTQPYHTQHRVSVTPLPRTRFHERVKNLEPEKTGSPTSEDKNPFSDDLDVKASTPSPSKVALTPPRKKKRAPPPPPMRQSSLTHITADCTLDISQNEDTLTDNVFCEDNSKEINDEKIEIKPEEKIEIKHEEKIEIKPEENIVDTQIDNKVKICDQQVENADSVEDNVEVKISKRHEIIILEDSADSAIVIKEIKICERLETTTEQCVDEENKLIDEVEATSEESSTLAENNIEDPEINFNSEVTLTSSQSSILSESKLELRQQEQALEDSSDLLQLVQKLQLEVEKLTDDTNNNIIATNVEQYNYCEYNENRTHFENRLKPAPDPPSKVKTEVNIILGSKSNGDDDDDVVTCSAPLSPRFVRLKEDNEWIRH